MLPTLGRKMLAVAVHPGVNIEINLAPCPDHEFVARDR